MGSRATRGLYRNPGGEVWQVRRQVPADLRHRFGWELKRSTETVDSRQAERRRDDFWREWDTLFQEARVRGEGALIGVYHVMAAIERWRRERCAATRAGPMERWLHHLGVTSGPGAYEPETLDALETLLDYASNDLARAKGVRARSREADFAEVYFQQNPGASRSPTTPASTIQFFARLQRAADEEHAWEGVRGFDDALTAAVEDGGLAGPLPAAVRPLVRRDFAIAWLEVEQHVEHERLRAALYAEALDVQGRTPATMLAPPIDSAAEPRPGDKTVREAIEAFRADREMRGERPEDWKRYGHAPRVMEELFGSDTPLRSVSREKARAAVALLRRVPANATKKFPGLTLEAAAEAGEAAGAKPLAPNTLNNLIGRMRAIVGFGIGEGWASEDPFRGLSVEPVTEVERRSFSEAELQRVFAGLQEERNATSARWWVPALALYQGARLNELAQLHVNDVKCAAGVWYIDVTEFDDSGRRVASKRLKNDSSRRVVPIHPRIIEAGFLEVVEQRRGGSSRNLFPDLRERETGNFGRDLSRWFGRHLDSIGLSDPALVFHSFRHTWTDAARASRMPDRVQDALAGWEVKGQAGKYGNVQALPTNLTHLAEVHFGGFALPL